MPTLHKPTMKNAQKFVKAWLWSVREHPVPKAAVPLSARVSGLSLALLLMVTVPVLLPSNVGVNVI